MRGVQITIACYDGRVVRDNAQLVHVALRSSHHAENTDRDLVGVLREGRDHFICRRDEVLKNAQKCEKKELFCRGE